MTEISQKQNDLKMSFTMLLFFKEQQVKQPNIMCDSITANRASFSCCDHSRAKSIVGAGSMFGCRLGEGI